MVNDGSEGRVGNVKPGRGGRGIGGRVGKGNEGMLNVGKDGSVGLRPAEDSGFLSRCSDYCHEAGVELFYKPHLAYWGSFDWRGAIAFDDERSWARFFRDYSAFIVDHAGDTLLSSGSFSLAGDGVSLVADRNRDFLFASDSSGNVDVVDLSGVGLPTAVTGYAADAAGIGRLIRGLWFSLN